MVGEIFIEVRSPLFSPHDLREIERNAHGHAHGHHHGTARCRTVVERSKSRRSQVRRGHREVNPRRFVQLSQGDRRKTPPFSLERLRKPKHEALARDEASAIEKGEHRAQRQRARDRILREPQRNEGQLAQPALTVIGQQWLVDVFGKQRTIIVRARKAQLDEFIAGITRGNEGGRDGTGRRSYKAIDAMTTGHKFGDRGVERDAFRTPSIERHIEQERLRTGLRIHGAQDTMPPTARAMVTPCAPLPSVHVTESTARPRRRPR